MAIARGAGTEIIRISHLNIVDSTGRNLIIGVQHHTYTVLSVICYAASVQADGNYLRMYLVGYDALGGTTAQAPEIFRQDMSALQTYVWNDKFSFNGTEPTNFSGPLDDATKQDAVADQGTTTPQYLGADSQHADDHFIITTTFLDQNNA